jgi:anti-sigma B factor antagonist
MTFSITDQETEHAHLVALDGELDLHVAPDVKHHLHKLMKAGKRRLVVDLCATSFIDSTAIGMLIAAGNRAQASGGLLTLVCDEPNVLRVFELIAMDQYLPVYASLEEAVPAAA